MKMRRGSIYKWPLITGAFFLSMLMAFQIFVLIHPEYSVEKPLGVLLLNIGFFVIPFTISLLITKLFRVIKKKENKL